MANSKPETNVMSRPASSKIDTNASTSCDANSELQSTAFTDVSVALGLCSDQQYAVSSFNGGKSGSENIWEILMHRKQVRINRANAECDGEGNIGATCGNFTENVEDWTITRAQHEPESQRRPTIDKSSDDFISLVDSLSSTNEELSTNTVNGSSSTRSESQDDSSEEELHQRLHHQHKRSASNKISLRSSSGFSECDQSDSVSQVSSNDSDSDYSMNASDAEEDLQNNLDLNLVVPSNHHQANNVTGPFRHNMNLHNRKAQTSYMSLYNDYNPIKWLNPNRHYSLGVFGLHEEILDFYEYIRPRPYEMEVRNQVVKRLTAIVKRAWPKSRVEVFGSYKTQLFLPTSDMDVVIFGEWKKSPLYTLELELVQAKMAIPTKIQVLPYASVPLVKFIDEETGIKVDISFNTQDGISTYQLINKFKNEFPHLPKLVMVLKLFLAVRRMNEVFTGGISSYCVTLLVVSFLQMHYNDNVRLPNYNLGALLIEFFDLYGRKFNYAHLGIRIRNNGAYVPKDELRRQMNSNSTSLLCIEDPICPTNELAKGSFAMSNTKFAFENAYVTLNNACSIVSYYNYSNIPYESILGLIIGIPPEMDMFRENLRSKYAPNCSSNHNSGPAHIVSIQHPNFSQNVVPFNHNNNNRSIAVVNPRFLKGINRNINGSVVNKNNSNNSSNINTKSKNSQLAHNRPLQTVHPLLSRSSSGSNKKQQSSSQTMFDAELISLASSSPGNSDIILLDSDEDLKDSKTRLIQSAALSTSLDDRKAALAEPKKD